MGGNFSDVTEFSGAELRIVVAGSGIYWLRRRRS